MAGSLQEWSSLQHRWNPLHTPHLHSWGLAKKKEKGMNVVAVEMTLPENLDKRLPSEFKGKDQDMA